MKYIDRGLRYLIIAVGAAAEILLVTTIFRYFSAQYVWIEKILALLGSVIGISIANNSRHLSMDLIWILIIFLFPVPGTLVYLLLGADLIRSQTARNLYHSGEQAKQYYKQEESVLTEAESELPGLKGDMHYLSRSAGYTFYRNTGFQYYSLGEDGFQAMLEELEKAERFVFLEYFIIEEGFMWERMHEILKRKARRGLDIRVMYDDAGSMRTLSAFYSRRLEKEGIKCVRFNKINPVIGAVMNHRDHRKIMVIDGMTAFTGGINLADEYINKKSPFGHWKDNCVRIRGDAVWSFTLMFLENWNALRRTDKDYSCFRCTAAAGQRDGYIAPYAATPFSRQDNTGRSVYINMINSARDYLYITTPYLIIDNEMENALILAARKGVEVVILTPGIPDKRMIWWISRSYFGSLIDAGVQIYSYTPGFVHAKTFITDDCAAAVGTFNLDFRSLYLHFENGVYLCGSSTVKDIREDFRSALAQSHRLKKEELKYGIFKRAVVGFAKLFVSQM